MVLVVCRAEVPGGLRATQKLAASRRIILSWTIIHPLQRSVQKISVLLTESAEICGTKNQRLAAINGGNVGTSAGGLLTRDTLNSNRGGSSFERYRDVCAPG